jgi:hypothetical protein
LRQEPQKQNIEEMRKHEGGHRNASKILSLFLD